MKTLRQTGPITVYVLINGNFYSRVDYSDREIMDAINFIRRMEQWGNKYIQEHPTHHFAVATLSRKHGNDWSEIFYEDKVNINYLRSADKLHDEAIP